MTNAMEPDTLQRRYVKLSLEVACPGCGQPLRPTGPRAVCTCPACGAQVTLPPALFSALVTRVEDDYPDLPWDRGHERLEAVSGMAVRVVSGRKWPRCGKCDQRLEPAVVDAGRALLAPCLHCGAEARGAPPPTWLSRVAPTVAFVIETGGPTFYLRLEGESERMRSLREASETTARAHEQGRRHPPCPACGAPLPAPDKRCGRCRKHPQARRRGRALRRLVWAGAVVALALPLFLLAKRIHRHWGAIRTTAATFADELDARPRSVTEDPGRTLVAAQRHLRWRLSSPEQRGLSAAALDPCQLTAIATRPAGSPLALQVAIQCGQARPVFEARAREHGTRLQCELEERPMIAPAHYEYDLRCTTEDDGGLPRLTLDTRTGALALQRSDGRFSARITRADGTGVGPALFLDPGTGAAFEPMRIRVSRSAHEGQVSLPAGEPCEVRVGPTGQPKLPCRVRVECGDRIAYGDFGGGFCACRIEQGRVVSAHDDQPSSVDGDPRLWLSLADGRARIDDDAPNYRIDLEWHAPE